MSFKGRTGRAYTEFLEKRAQAQFARHKYTNRDKHIAEIKERFPLNLSVALCDAPQVAIGVVDTVDIHGSVHVRGEQKIRRTGGRKATVLRTLAYSADRLVPFVQDSS